MDTTIDPATGLSPHLARLDQIHGLRQLADFLEAHPHIPIPEIQGKHLATAEARAEFVDGLDALEVDQSDNPKFGHMVRRFGSLELRCWVRLNDVGETTEVPSTTVEFRPWTPGQLADHARLAVSA